MADELTIVAGLEFAKGNVSIPSLGGRQALDVSGTDCIKRTQTIGTSAEALDIGEITTCGWMFARNLDAANYVSFRMGASGADFARLDAGEWWALRLAGNTPYAIANSAPVTIEYAIIED
jgi:hypothetical protein